MIPVKIVVDGDLVRGKELIGFAKDQMRILQRLMSFRKLNEGNRQVQPFPGVLVECWSSYSIKEIYIYVAPPKPAGGVPIIPPKEERTPTQAGEDQGPRAAAKAGREGLPPG